MNNFALMIQKEKVLVVSGLSVMRQGSVEIRQMLCSPTFHIST
jgi:hypothetical protein